MLLERLSFYIVLVRRHRAYGNRRQAVSFALHHCRFWNGASADSTYAHIGQQQPGR